MGHYQSNLRDIVFNLFEVNDVASLLDQPPYEDFDTATVHHLLVELERLATEDMAASFVEADRHAPHLVDGSVTLPAGLKRSLDAYYDGGWDMLAVPRELGGLGAPSQVRWAGQEMLIGANPTAFFYIIGGLMAVAIGAVGTPEQADSWARRMLERRWGGTMVLTEPDAGSDVGAGTTRAIAVDEPNGVYHLEGVKRFITSGASDYHENIVHLVLARRDGGAPGTKGLSMFIVPNFLVGEDGSLGERNGIAVTAVEDKMGIRSSTTCELTLGAERPCVGYLVGGVHDGIRQMFHVIEDARMLIGAKSMSTLSTGYLNALEYAKVRVQSADLTRGGDSTAPRVEIIRHPDIRRLLMTQKAHAEGMRALLYHTAWALDQARVDPDDDHWERLSDLLLPMLKGYSSEKAYELLGQALQVFGGSGYTRDYPMEQYIRDVKIDSLYEGTTAVQALDLFFRKIVRDQGRTLARLGEDILEMVKGGFDELEEERALLGRALEDAQAQIGVMVGHAAASTDEPEQIYRTGLHTNALLESLSEVVIGWLLLRHAEVALTALPAADPADADFYRGKVASARYFARTVLPKAGLRRRAAEAEDGAVMAVPDAAF
ncbi:MAG: acyl-CoA dehydrogenase [Acidimicrobiia bacterium]|nr:acyl-CoA dehydrogenase [Acidimicrobiia bacterium]